MLYRIRMKISTRSYNPLSAQLRVFNACVVWQFQRGVVQVRRARRLRVFAVLRESSLRINLILSQCRD